MRRKKRSKKKPDEQHTLLAIRVGRYETCIGASINHKVYAPQHAWNIDERDPLYEFTAQLIIQGMATYPEDRAGETYEVTIYGDDAASRRCNATLRDAQARDEYGAPKYRPYRGRQVPVYEPPNGLGFLDKVRGEPRWTAWLFAAPRFVSDTLVLLGQQTALFMAIHERKEGRTRRIQSLTLQTADPAQE